MSEQEREVSPTVIGESHEHEWKVYSGSTDGYLHAYCQCGAKAIQTFDGRVYGVKEPSPERML